MSTPDSLLTALGFSKKHAVHGRASIADLFPERGRSGIYVLHMADDTCYVGLSTDVTKRYQQHRLTYPDIVALSFKRVGKNIGLLREAERDAIHHLDSHSIPLLNKVHNSISYHSSPLDLIIPPEEQRRWLETGTYTVGAHVPAPGFDQMNVSTRDHDTTVKILSDPIIQKSARLMNLNLMRQRGSFYSQFHSPGLTDLALETGYGQL